MDVNHVEGRNMGKVMLYALSGCPWCRKAKALLDELQVEYSYVDVDKLQGEERMEAMAEVEKWNPEVTFPSIVFEDSRIIVGFDEERIRERLNK